MAHSSYYLIGVVLSVIALPVKAQDAAMVSAASDKGSIVARINASASGISVEAPQALIDRAERVEPSAEPVIEDAEVHEQESMVVRTKVVKPLAIGCRCMPTTMPGVPKPKPGRESGQLVRLFPIWAHMCHMFRHIGGCG